MSGLRYVYGRHPVEELLRGQPRSIKRVLAGAGRLESLAHLARRAGVPVSPVSKRALDDLVGAVPHQGVVAEVEAFAYAGMEAIFTRAAGAAPLIVALDQVQDPHNLGSLIRSAFALGAHGLIFPKDRACEVTPTVIKTAAGATAHLPICRVTNLRRALDELKERGVWIVGTQPEASQSLAHVDLRQPTALVVGSEGTGMRKLTAEACDFRVRIPMPGDLGSLNASVAGAICLYEAARQRANRPGES
jgi:23S rRNA (guanosine2251-2'-O)-methyltransferase